jgi:transposase
VKLYVQTNKSDYLHAEAIAEAVQRPRMRFVSIKTNGQLDLQAPHRLGRRLQERNVARSVSGCIHLRPLGPGEGNSTCQVCWRKTKMAMGFSHALET